MKIELLIRTFKTMLTVARELFLDRAARPRAPKSGTRYRGLRWNWRVFLSGKQAFTHQKKRSSPDLEHLFDPKTSVLQKKKKKGLRRIWRVFFLTRNHRFSKKKRRKKGFRQIWSILLARKHRFSPAPLLPAPMYVDDHLYTVCQSLLCLFMPIYYFDQIAEEKNHYRVLQTYSLTLKSTWKIEHVLDHYFALSLLTILNNNLRSETSDYCFALKSFLWNNRGQQTSYGAKSTSSH